MTKVWVVMSSDYPDSVFSDEETAEAYVKRRREGSSAYSGKIDLKDTRPRIYWRSYEFELNYEPGYNP